MSKQPRLRDKLSHSNVKLGKDTPKWVFVPDWTRETDLGGVAWSALIRSGEVNVCRVSNDGDGDNYYEIITPELMDWLVVDASKKYPLALSSSLTGFVADLWLASLEVQINGRDAAAEMGF